MIWRPFTIHNLACVMQTWLDDAAGPELAHYHINTGLVIQSTQIHYRPRPIQEKNRGQLPLYSSVTSYARGVTLTQNPLRVSRNFADSESSPNEHPTNLKSKGFLQELPEMLCNIAIKLSSPVFLGDLQHQRTTLMQWPHSSPHLLISGSILTSHTLDVSLGLDGA